MIVDCAHYRDGQRQQAGPMEIEQAAELARREDQDGFIWIGLFEPAEEELGAVQRQFGLSELAVEDAQSFHLRPKIEQYDNGAVLFVVLRTAAYVDEREEVQFGEVSVFLSQRFVITVRQGVASELHGVRMRLEGRPDLLSHGSSAVLWAILDRIVDGYAPVVEGLEQDVDQVEDTVFWGRRRQPSGSTAAQRRHRLLPRRAPPARPPQRRSARRLPSDRHRAAALRARRQRPPRARQRGGDRSAGVTDGTCSRPTWR